MSHANGCRMVHPRVGAAGTRGLRAVSIGVDRIAQRALVGTGSGRTTGTLGDSDFDSLLQPAGRPSAPAGTNAITASGLAMVQADPDGTSARQAKDREARRHARAVLKALGAVQLAVLGTDAGQANRALLELAKAAADQSLGDDPRLCLVVREIAVRAAVELARNEFACG